MSPWVILSLFYYSISCVSFSSQPVFIVIWNRIPNLISLASHSNIQLPINKEGAFLLLPASLDAVSLQILTRLLPPCSLHKNNSTSLTLPARCHSLSPAPWPQASHRADQTAFSWQSQQIWEGRVVESQKGRRRGVRVVSPATGTAAGWLPIHSLSSVGLGPVSLPSCVTNELPNASQTKKLWVLAFKCEQRSVGHKTSDEKKGKGSNSLKIQGPDPKKRIRLCVCS